MRTIIFAALAGLMTLSSVQMAHAKRSGISYGSVETLEYVAETEITAGAGGGTLALCHHVKTYELFHLPVFSRSLGYTLAQRACMTDRYFAFTENELAQAQFEGLIAPDIPVQARLGRDHVIYNAKVAGGVALVIMALAGLAIRRRSRRKALLAQMGGISPVAIRVLDAMCHAAKADGRIDGSEIDTIARASVDLIGTHVATARIAKMIRLPQTRLAPKDYARFGKGLNADGKRLVMRGALMVAASDGTFHKKEQAFITGLAHAFRISAPDLTAMLAELAGRPSPSAAAAHG